MRDHPTGSDDAVLDLALRAAAVLAGLGAIAWATAKITGRLTSGEWPQITVSQMGPALAHLASHPADPAVAFPPAARHLIPGPVPFWAVFAVLLAAAITLLVLGWRLFREGEGPYKEETGARWATARDLRELRVRGPKQGRVILGRGPGGLLATEPRHSVLVLGPTQSMKTTGLAIPAILEWDGPVIATSVKTDLVRDTIGHRQTKGTVWIYDPTESTGLPTSSWNPLASCTTWNGAVRMVSDLVRAAEPEFKGPDTEHWQSTGGKLLTALMHAAALGDFTMADVTRWLDTKDHKEPRRILRDPEHRAALSAATASFGREVRQQDSVYSTAEVVLRAFIDPAVQRSAERDEIDPTAITLDPDDGDTTLYLCASMYEQDRLQPLYTCLLQRALVAAYQHASSRRDGCLERPLLLVLDEAANIAPLRNLDQVATTAASHGIQLVSIFQDLAQVRARYGHRADTVRNNHRAKILLSGVSDPPTLDWFATLLGNREAPHRSETRDDRGRQTRSRTTNQRPLAGSEVLRMTPPGEGVLVYGHLPPVQLKLRPWFRDPALLRAGRTEVEHWDPPSINVLANTQSNDKIANPTADRITLADHHTREASTDLPEEFLSAAEAARMLGITRQAVHSRWRHGTLPYVEIERGGRLTRVIRIVDLAIAAEASESEL